MRKADSAVVKKRVLIVLQFIFFWGLFVSAQSPKKANIWYFGDKAGLDFTGGNPVAITDGAMSAFEGTAVMSDATGNLLFYSNGGDLPYTGGVWNKNHQLMPNGDLQGSGGCGSSFQSSIILQHGKHRNLYYLFTTDCIENNSVGGLRYSIIDMTLDGGLGDIIVKGQLLTTPVDESLTAIRHANGEDYWILAHKIHTDSFYVYHLTHAGITGLVKTRIGPATPDYAGALKASTNGQKIVHSGLDFTALYNFDTETGTIFNYVNLGIPGYSASFSPNCQFLYIADGIGKHIYQFDMAAYDIAASAVLVGNTTSTGIGGMQLGPNGQIYVARFVTSEYLGTIMYPNHKGAACNYIDNGIYLAGKFGKGGLPNFANDIVGECTAYNEENNPITNRYPNHDPRSNYISGSYFSLVHNAAGNRKGSSHYQHLDGHLIDTPGREQENSNFGISAAMTTSTGDFNFDLYPNPAMYSSNITVNTGDRAVSLDIIIMESNGKIIEEYNYDNVSGLNNFSIPTRNLINGIYHIAVQSDNAYFIKKLIVMK